MHFFCKSCSSCPFTHTFFRLSFPLFSFFLPAFTKFCILLPKNNTTCLFFEPCADNLCAAHTHFSASRKAVPQKHARRTHFPAFHSGLGFVRFFPCALKTKTSGRFLSFRWFFECDGFVFMRRQCGALFKAKRGTLTSRSPFEPYGRFASACGESKAALRPERRPFFLVIFTVYHRVFRKVIRQQTYLLFLTPL